MRGSTAAEEPLGQGHVGVGRVDVQRQRQRLLERRREQEVDELLGLVAGVRAAQDAATGTGAAQIPTAPEAFDDGLEEVGQLQKQAEAAVLMDQTAEALEFLEQAETEMTALEQRYSDQIPKGHATLIVTKEKIAALKDQLAAASGD